MNALTQMDPFVREVDSPGPGTGARAAELRWLFRQGCSSAQYHDLLLHPSFFCHLQLPWQSCTSLSRER